MNEKHPNRKKDKHNPYTLMIAEGRYYLSFIDGRGVMQNIEIDKVLYDLFNRFELEDISYLNRVSRHLSLIHIYRLICLLVKNANRIITRDTILDELWDSTGDYVDNNTLSVYVRRLREKVETDPSHPEHLLTVRGFGYQWKEVDE